MAYCRWTFSYYQGRVLPMKSREKAFSGLYFPFCLIFFEKIEHNGEYGAFRAENGISFTNFVIQRPQMTNGKKEEGSCLLILVEMEKERQKETSQATSPICLLFSSEKRKRNPARGEFCKANCLSRRRDIRFSF